MDFFTHLVFGGLMYLLFLGEVTLDYFFLAIFFSILPDLDVFLAPLRRKFNSNYLEHRGGSHSYVIGIIISFIIAGLRALLAQRPFIIAWIIGIAFYGLHVSMDLLTTTKIPYLFPLSKKEHCFYVEKAGSFFTFVNSIIFLILPWFLFWIFPSILFMEIYISLYTYFFIVYYIYRILSKIFIARTLNPNQKYLPGLLPFYYKIYGYEAVGNNIQSSIRKKAHFSKKTEIIEFKKTLTNQEKEFYDQALELNKKHYYFAKWTLFPAIIRTEKILAIRLYFLETMMRTRHMYVQFNFDLDTQAFIGTEQSSRHIQNEKEIKQA
ncbi:MAG: metal-dependent hydrolase [Promethearchaeota archaeon]|jgi:membrane-bound metal-dependent hydrolase YbcI (DUF457 family)